MPGFHNPCRLRVRYRAGRNIMTDILAKTGVSVWKKSPRPPKLHLLIYRRNTCLRLTNAGLFHYAGNCPVRYIDPDGKKIKIEHNGDFGFYMDVLESMQYLKQSEIGRKIINELENSSIVFTIKRCYSIDDDHAYGTEVFWTPDQTMLAENGEFNSPAICLIHELVHVWNNTSDGMRNFVKFYNANKDKIKNPTFQFWKESFTTEIEKKVAHQLKEPEGRRNYHNIDYIKLKNGETFAFYVNLPEHHSTTHSQSDRREK